MKELLQRAVGPRKRIVRATKPKDLAAFFHSLRPVGCNVRLKRFGPKGDGGYLMPDDLDGIVACISPGVDIECGFDLDLAERGIPVFLADASVDAPAESHPNFHFTAKFLDCSETNTTTRLSSFVDLAPPDGDLVLQMDIEGAEYRVLLDSSPALLERFRIIVVEFHELDQLFSRFSFGIISSVFRKLMFAHDVVHIHPNNCQLSRSSLGYAVPPVLEFTFYRRDRNDGRKYAHPGFPHPLDVDNLPDRRHLVLPECWWR